MACTYAPGSITLSAVDVFGQATSSLSFYEMNAQPQYLVLSSTNSSSALATSMQYYLKILPISSGACCDNALSDYSSPKYGRPIVSPDYSFPIDGLEENTYKACIAQTSTPLDSSAFQLYAQAYMYVHRMQPPVPPPSASPSPPPMPPSPPPLPSSPPSLAFGVIAQNGFDRCAFESQVDKRTFLPPSAPPLTDGSSETSTTAQSPSSQASSCLTVGVLVVLIISGLCLIFGVYCLWFCARRLRSVQCDPKSLYLSAIAVSHVPRNRSLDENITVYEHISACEPSKCLRTPGGILCVCCCGCGTIIFCVVLGALAASGTV